MFKKTHMKICVENALAARTYARFLEREVYAFLSTLDKRGERVCGDSCGPAFFVCGRAAKATRESGTGKGKKIIFSFSGRGTQRFVSEKGRAE